MSKYHSQKITTPDGVFDSKREYERWRELKILEIAGQIHNLRRQVVFELIPAQYEGEGKKRRCVEYPCRYKADFVYIRDGKQVVEDSKGFKTDDYKIKRKLMRWVHGIGVRET